MWRNFCALQCGRKRRRRMRKRVLGEKRQCFCGWKKHAEEVWAKTGEESVCSAASLCVRVRTHAKFVSAISLIVVLYQGLIYKALQMIPKPRIFVPVRIWCLYNFGNSFPEFARGKSPAGSALPVPPVHPVRRGIQRLLQRLQETNKTLPRLVFFPPQNNQRAERTWRDGSSELTEEYGLTLLVGSNKQVESGLTENPCFCRSTDEWKLRSDVAQDSLQLIQLLIHSRPKWRASQLGDLARHGGWSLSSLELTNQTK